MLNIYKPLKDIIWSCTRSFSSEKLSTPRRRWLRFPNDGKYTKIGCNLRKAHSSSGIKWNKNNGWLLEGPKFKTIDRTISQIHQASWNEVKSQNAAAEKLPVTLVAEMETRNFENKKSITNGTQTKKQDKQSSNLKDKIQDEGKSKEPEKTAPETGDTRKAYPQVRIRPGRPAVENYKETLEKLKRHGILKKRQQNSFMGMTSPSSHPSNTEPALKTPIKKFTRPNLSLDRPDRTENPLLESTLAYKLERYYKTQGKDRLDEPLSFGRTQSDSNVPLKWHRPQIYPCTSPCKSRNGKTFENK